MRTRIGVATLAAAIAALAVFGGTASSAPRATVEVRVVTLPIANGLPLDIGIRRGFFEQQGIQIAKRTLQSGNDIVLALENNSGEIGYVGWVPAMIARTQGIPLTAVAASDVEGTSVQDNWQNILVKGSSSIRTPADLAGKTIAVNALKGVGEVMIKARSRNAASTRARCGCWHCRSRPCGRRSTTGRSTRSGRRSRSCRRR